MIVLIGPVSTASTVVDRLRYLLATSFGIGNRVSLNGNPEFAMQCPPQHLNHIYSRLSTIQALYK